MITEFTVLGGDERLKYMAEDFCEQGFSVKLFGFDSENDYCETDFQEKLREILRETKALILPVPASRDGININSPLCNSDIPIQTVVENLNSECRVFCGMAGKLSDVFFKKGIRVYDYAMRDEFSVRNAVPTAEGVCAILINELPITLRFANIFITGYGKTARACAKLFSSLGSHVTVAARRCSSLATANSEGYEALYIRELHRHIHKADAVINTVPALIIDEKIIDNIRLHCPLVEIASAPYGIDFDYAEKRGLKVINTPSLPGKTSPKTAGIIIGDTVLNIIREGQE